MAENQMKVETFLADKPKELHGLFTKIVEAGEQNQVVHQLHAGLAAMELGHNDLAAKTFDDALRIIETIYGSDEKAAQARSLFGDGEGTKVFRGEPYERAMTYYYRGILYLMEGDYENARASFKSGFLQDTLAETEEFRGDFALLAFLEGWASQCNGNQDLAAEAYAVAKEHNGGLIMPGPQDNALVLADIGYAPLKYTTDMDLITLKIVPSKKEAPESTAFLVSRNVTHALPNSESIAWQATTRGGREIYAVLESKQQVKGVATAFAIPGAVLSVAPGVAAVALGPIVVGAALGATALGMTVAGNVNAAADLRQWTTLPDKVAYGTYRVFGNDPKPKVEFDDSFVNANLLKTRHGGNHQCAVSWIRSRTASDLDAWKRNSWVSNIEGCWISDKPLGDSDDFYAEDIYDIDTRKIEIVNDTSLAVTTYATRYNNNALVFIPLLQLLVLNDSLRKATNFSPSTSKIFYETNYDVIEKNHWRVGREHFPYSVDVEYKMLDHDTISRTSVIPSIFSDDEVENFTFHRTPDENCTIEGKEKLGKNHDA